MENRYNFTLSPRHGVKTRSGPAGLCSTKDSKTLGPNKGLSNGASIVEESGVVARYMMDGMS